MYMARTPLSTLGSSNGTFLLACIITRMMTRLVLWAPAVGQRCVQGYGSRAVSASVHLGVHSGVGGVGK